MQKTHPNGMNRLAPARMAHFVVRTGQFADTVKWYTTFFEADTVFANDSIAFLSFDEEHHRLAILNTPNAPNVDDRASAIDHVAFSYETLEPLMESYARLKDAGIVPVVALNHGPTTSLYYADPVGNKIEIQVDNFATTDDARAFFFSDTFRDNQVGVVFNPDLLLARMRAGTPTADLLRQDAAVAS